MPAKSKKPVSKKKTKSVKPQKSNKIIKNKVVPKIKKDHSVDRLIRELKSYELNKEYDLLIKKLKIAVQENKNILSDNYIKSWLGKRWRNIFISEAIKDPIAMEAATYKKIFGTDDRSEKQKIATRFLKGEGPDEWRLEMPEAPASTIANTTLVFCPGLLTGLLPVMAFGEAFPKVKEKYGYITVQSDSHPMRGCEANTKDILKAIEKGIGLDENSQPIEEKNAFAPKDIFLITYSKGAPDLMHLLVKHPELKKRIRCVFIWAGAPGGSYLANSLYESVKQIKIDINIPEELSNLIKLVSPVITIPDKVKRLAEYDIVGALHDLTTQKRENFLEHNLNKINDLGIPFFNITASTTAIEVPYFQLQGVLELNKYDANNDMQVVQKHSKLSMPMATDLAMLHGHHWDVSYGPFPPRMRFGSPNLDHPFPKEAALSAMFRFAIELGLID